MKPLFFLSLLFISFQSISQNTENEYWQDMVNRNAKEIERLYFPKAVKVDATGAVFQTAQEIKNELKKFTKKLSNIQVIKNVPAGRKAAYAYEIGSFQVKKKTYYHLIVWNAKGEEKLRELEVVAVSKKTDDLSNEIEAARNLWMELCNAHDAQKLVETLYTSNAVYYNHKPVVVGTEAISKEYSYMNNEKYGLRLAPVQLQMVSPTLAFEIGQCSGSYGGKYVIVWQKQKSGNWQVLLDSNI